MPIPTEMPVLEGCQGWRDALREPALQCQRWLLTDFIDSFAFSYRSSFRLTENSAVLVLLVLLLNSRSSGRRKGLSSL